MDELLCRFGGATLDDDDEPDRGVQPGAIALAVSLNGGESFGLAALDANGDGEGADEALLKYALLPRMMLVEPPGRRTRRRDSLRQMRCVLSG